MSALQQKRVFITYNWSSLLLLYLGGSQRLCMEFESKRTIYPLCVCLYICKCVRSVCEPSLYITVWRSFLSHPLSWKNSHKPGYVESSYKPGAGLGSHLWDGSRALPTPASSPPTTLLSNSGWFPRVDSWCLPRCCVQGLFRTCLLAQPLLCRWVIIFYFPSGTL